MGCVFHSLHALDPALPRSVCRVLSALGFIEEWDFSKDGKHFVVKSRALHGPAKVELMETETGKVVTEVQASADKLPEWATPYHE